MPSSTPVVPASEQSIADAAELLRAGRLVVFPTETVYGLGADATNDTAVAEIFRCKNRPRFNPLIVHVPDAAGARALVHWPPSADRLAQALWPGPLTLVLRRRADCGVSLLVSCGLDTVAIRVPAHDVATALLERVGRPIAAPSANRSSDISPTTADHAVQSLGKAVALVLDAGPCRVGLESTIVDLSRPTPTLLRPGGVAVEEIEEIAGPIRTEPTREPPRAPGMLARHYAPSLPLRLNATEVGADEALLAFGPDVPVGAAVTANLSPRGDLVEAAANLFAMMRALDRPGWRAIAAMRVPETSLGRAINDRLRRAAAPRSDDSDLPLDP